MPFNLKEVFLSTQDKDTLALRTAGSLIPGRELTAREQLSLALAGKPDQAKIAALVTAKDAWGEPSTSSSYALIGKAQSRKWKDDVLIKEANNVEDKQIREITKVDLRSTAILDHLLDKASPAEKAGLLKAGMVAASNVPDSYDCRLSNIGYSTIMVGEEIQDTSNKLLVLARHGGDLNLAVQSATDPKMIERNAKLLKFAHQTMTRETAQYIIDRDVLKPQSNITWSMHHRDNVLLGPALLAGGVFEKGYEVGNLKVTNPLGIAIAAEPETNLFDTLLARGEKPDAAHLYYVAAHGRDYQSSIEKLQAYGLDINTPDSTGKNVLTRIASELSFKEMQRESTSSDTTRRSQEHSLSDYKSVIGFLEKKGADKTHKDASGMNAEDYANRAISAFEKAGTTGATADAQKKNSGRTERNLENEGVLETRLMGHWTPSIRRAITL